MFSFLGYDDSHKRGPASRPVVGTEIQRDCNFEAHVYYFSHRLGCISGHWSIQLSQLHYNCLVRLYRCVILPSYLHCLVHKDFSHSQSSSGSSTRSLSTTAEPSKCYEHGRIQKGTVQCTVGAVSFSCLLYTLFDNARCDLF